MKQVAGRGGHPCVFELERDEGGLWLSYSWAEPGSGWASGREFVFTLRKSEPQNPQKLGLLDRLFKR